MGTRNLTIVKSNGEYKIAQYGQWDGYPSGQGLTALTFLRSKTNRNQLKRQLKHCVFVPLEDLQLAYRTDSDRFETTYPFMNRDHGAEILELVANTKNKPIFLQNEIAFSGDSLFCEWAYVVDFDKNTFEVYEGFNKEPLKEGERFAPYDQGKEYRPIRLVRKYSLDKLPTDKSFLKLENNT